MIGQVMGLMGHVQTAMKAKALYDSGRYKVAYELPDGQKGVTPVRGRTTMDAIDTVRAKVPNGRNFRAFKIPEQEEELDEYMGTSTNNFSIINYTKNFGMLGEHQTAILTGAGALAGGALARSIAKKKAYKAALARGLNPAQAEAAASTAANKAMVGGALAGAALGNAGSRFANSWQEAGKADPKIGTWDRIKAAGKGVGESYKNDWNNNEGWWGKTKALIGVKSNPGAPTPATPTAQAAQATQAAQTNQVAQEYDESIDG